tara:strand:- start:189 stop:428 length:240 start_codon:yes stop_codon:yes gene_type:complete
MANLGKFVHTNTGKTIMSIILGLGLASLFRKVCKNYNCIQLYAAPLDKIEGKIFQLGDKCVKYNYETAKCHDGSLIKFE